MQYQSKRSGFPQYQNQWQYAYQNRYNGGKRYADGSACPKYKKQPSFRHTSPPLLIIWGTPDNFYGGKISDNFAYWRRLTSDKWILLQVQGVQVEFQENPSNIPHKREIVFNSTDDELVKQNIFHLLKGLF